MIRTIRTIRLPVGLSYRPLQKCAKETPSVENVLHLKRCKQRMVAEASDKQVAADPGGRSGKTLRTQRMLSMHSLPGLGVTLQVVTWVRCMLVCQMAPWSANERWGHLTNGVLYMYIFIVPFNKAIVSSGRGRMRTVNDSVSLITTIRLRQIKSIAPQVSHLRLKPLNCTCGSYPLPSSIGFEMMQVASMVTIVLYHTMSACGQGIFYHIRVSRVSA